MSKARELSELADVVTVDGTGNVGIGTGSPTGLLTLDGGGDSYIAITHSAGMAAGLVVQNRANGQEGLLSYNSDPGNEHWKCSLNGSEAMRVNSNGILCINSTTPNGYEKVYAVNDNVVASFFRTGTSGGVINIQNNNGIVGSISTSGSTTAYNTSSDYRLKEDVQPMANAIDRVKDLKPVNFAWKVDGSRTDGFIAHELQAVVPEAATGAKDAMRDEEYEVTPAVPATYDDDGNELTPAIDAVMGTRSVPDYQGIDQSKLVPLLTAALQEALGKIDALEARLTALETP